MPVADESGVMLRRPLIISVRTERGWNPWPPTRPLREEVQEPRCLVWGCGHTGGVWTCPQCRRRFANTHQWHSCIEFTLEAALAEASEHARCLYEATARTVAACGSFRIHPQKTRIAFITTMTFAGVKLARRWVDVSFITAVPIDDPRIKAIEAYGPTSFGHTLRLHEVDQLDSTVKDWLCQAWRRGNHETLDPDAHVTPLVGRALDVVVVPLRTTVVEEQEALALKLPRYAAEIFENHPSTQVRIGKVRVSGMIHASSGRRWFLPAGPDLRELGLGAGDPVDAFLRAGMTAWV